MWIIIASLIGNFLSAFIVEIALDSTVINYV